MRKVTDLEAFAVEQIFRPYQTMVGFGDEILKQIPMSIDAIPAFAAKNPDWWLAVENRIHRIGFWFPQYIQHPIVTMLLPPSKDKE